MAYPGPKSTPIHPQDRNHRRETCSPKIFSSVGALAQITTTPLHAETKIITCETGCIYKLVAEMRIYSIIKSSR